MDPMTMMMLGGGGLLGGISGFFGGQSQGRGYDDMARQMQQGMDEQRKLTGQANDFLNPFYQAGRGEIGGYQQNYKNLMDPNFINQLMGKYQTTDYAKHQLREGNQAISNAASASGNLNSGQFGKDMANYAQDITSKDQNSYLDRMLNQYGIGLGHQGSMVNQGGMYGNQMGQNLIGMGDRNMQSLMGQQSARMQGNQARQGGWASLMGGMNSMFSPQAQQAPAPVKRL